MGVAIGTPLAVTAAVVLIATFIQVFFGVIAAILWLTYGLIATVVAIVALRPTRPWLRRPQPLTSRRLFTILLAIWGVSWVAAALGYAIATAILTPGGSVTYALEVFGSAALGVAPFFLIYTLISGLQLKQLLRRPSGRVSKRESHGAV